MLTRINMSMLTWHVIKAKMSDTITYWIEMWLIKQQIAIMFEALIISKSDL